MPKTNRKLRVFLCHAKEDKSTVRELYRQLTAESWIDVWLDEEKLLPGQEWRLEIPKAIRDSDVILVCLSRNSITKAGYIQKEIRSALDLAEEKPEETIFVVPVRLEECDVPVRLAHWQWVDLYLERGQEWLMRGLELCAYELGIKSIQKKKSARTSQSPTINEAVKTTNITNTAKSKQKPSPKRGSALFIDESRIHISFFQQELHNSEWKLLFSNTKEEAYAHLRASKDSKEHIDVIALDLSTLLESNPPLASGTKLAYDLHSEFPSIPMLVYTTFGLREFDSLRILKDMLFASISFVYLRQLPEEFDFSELLRLARSGYIFISPGLSYFLSKAISSKGDPLDQMQWEALKLLSRGESFFLIAEKLNFSVETVKTLIFKIKDILSDAGEIQANSSIEDLGQWYEQNKVRYSRD